MLTGRSNISDTLIDKILDVMTETGKGNYSVQIELSGNNDAFDAIAKGINSMIDGIREGAQKAEEEKDLAHNIISSLSDLVVALDPQRKIISINDAGLQLTGYSSAQDLIGKNIRELFNEDPFGDENKQIIKNAENFLLNKSQEEIPVLFSASVIKNKEGNIVGIICSGRHVPEKKDTDNKLKEYMHHLEKAHKELDQFAYIVSHDLKAPLRAIANLSEWIEEDLGSNASEDIRKNMNILRGRVHRMEALINGILTYSKSTRSKTEASEIDLNELIYSIINNLVIPPDFSIVRKTRLPVITNNKSWMEQIFMNLLSNALKHHDKTEGKIEIDYSDEGKFYKFSVIDDGPGIPSEFTEKIFTIFQTLEARDKVENTGVGLAIAKKIVEEQGGRIWVEAAPGKGSAFCFTIPKDFKRS